MAETRPSPPGPRKRKLWLLALNGIIVLLIFVGLGFYLRSADFKDFVRQRIVAALEQATGGKVEIGALQWNLSKLEFELHNVNVRGTEGAGQAPFLHIDRIYGRGKLLSLADRQLGLSYLELDRPLLNVLLFVDNSTNAPHPERAARTSPPTDVLFDLTVGRAVVREGELQLRDHAVPFSFSATDLAL